MSDFKVSIYEKGSGKLEEVIAIDLDQTTADRVRNGLHQKLDKDYYVVKVEEEKK